MNHFIFRWIKRAVEFDVARSLELNVFLLNYFLRHNYFPSIEIQDYRHGLKDYSQDQLYESQHFRQHVEYIHGVYIMLSLLYDHDSRVSKSETNQRIAALDAYGKWVLAFFHLNLNPDFSSKFLEKKYSDNLIIYEMWYPNLEFDPEFKKITESKEIIYIYNISAPANKVEEVPYIWENYPTDPSLQEEMDQYRDSSELMFDIHSTSPNLTEFIPKIANYFGIYHFSNKNLISKILTLFRDYFCLRIPSESNNIANHMHCFEVLFHNVQGLLYKELNWQDLKKQFSNKTNEEFTEYFMETYCLSSQHMKFNDDFQKFNPILFIENYYEYLRKAFYYRLGVIRTGTFIIWRSMMKYFELLQTYEEFWKQKGLLLEKWCFEKVEKYGFQPYKIILLNKNRTSNDRYNSMKMNLKDLNDYTLEFEVGFPDWLDQANYREIDLVFRHEHMIFVYECKGTRDPLSEEKQLTKWSKNFKRNFELLESKIELLNYLVNSKLVDNQLFSGLKYHYLNLIQTEGLFIENLVIPPDEFELFLRALHDLIDNGGFNEVFG